MTNAKIQAAPPPPDRALIDGTPEGDKAFSDQTTAYLEWLEGMPSRLNDRHA